METHTIEDVNEMRDNGFWRVRKESTFLGHADEILSRLASESSQVVKAVAEPVPGSILSMAAQGGVFHIWGQVRQIMLNCEWKSEGGVLTPIFNRADGSPTSFGLKWTAPESMKVYFMVLADKPNACYRFMEAYLVATGEGVKGWRRLPLANTHDDGKLCLGGEFKGRSNASLAGLWAEAFSHFNNARFNSDLVRESTLTGAEKIFRFEAKTSQPKPVEGDWSRHCQIVNNSAYSLISP